MSNITNTQNLWIFFDKIVCITTSNSTRLSGFKDSMNKAGIRDVVYDIEDKVNLYNSGTFQCNTLCNRLRQRHLNIIENAKLNNYKNVLVFEDDARFMLSDSISDNEFNETLNFLQKSEWDLFYFGYSNACKRVVKINPFIHHLTNGVIHAHSYAINRIVYDELISYIKNNQDIHIDMIYYNLEYLMHRKIKKYCTSRIWFEQPIPNALLNPITKLILVSDKDDFEKSLKQHAYFNNNIIIYLPKIQEVLFFILIVIIASIIFRKRYGRKNIA